MKKGFHFLGKISASKSIYNRALIIQSFNSSIRLLGHSQANDVVDLKKALRMWKRGKTELDCGEGGTTFRFLAIRLSREPGRYILRGRGRLLSRPHQGLFKILKQLGVQVVVRRDEVEIISKGWEIPKEITVDVSTSSQFLSALLLSSWNLPKELHLRLKGRFASEDYFLMTEKVCANFGMQVRRTNKNLYIAADQKPKSKKMIIEPDMSSAFAVAALAALGGSAKILGFPKKSLQPDHIFVRWLVQMGVQVLFKKGALIIRGAKVLKPLNASLKTTPDLFPVLSILLSVAQGVSVLRDLYNLQHKESDRLKNTQDLLRLLQRKTVSTSQKIKIFGRKELFKVKGAWNPDGDHRMVMAAQLAKVLGANLKIKHAEVVKKSFPEFLKIMRKP